MMIFPQYKITRYKYAFYFLNKVIKYTYKNDEIKMALLSFLC